MGGGFYLPIKLYFFIFLLLSVDCYRFNSLSIIQCEIKTIGVKTLRHNYKILLEMDCPYCEESMSDVYTENGCYDHSVCMNEDCPERTEDRGYEFYHEPR